MRKWIRRRNWRNIGTTILGLIIILGGVGILVWLAWKLFTTASSDIVAAVITASFTLISGVLIVVYSRRQESKQEIEQEHRKQKIPIYDDFLLFYLGRLLGSRREGGKPLTEREMYKFRLEFTRRLMLWGSDEVVRKYSAMTKVIEGEEDASRGLKTLVYFEQLLYLIRADLGHKNEGLDSGDLLRLFVTDIDQKFAEGLEIEDD